MASPPCVFLVLLGLVMDSLKHQVGMLVKEMALARDLDAWNKFGPTFCRYSIQVRIDMAACPCVFCLCLVQ